MNYVYSGLLIMGCIGVLGWMIYQDYKNWKDFIQLIRERNYIWYLYQSHTYTADSDSQTYVTYTTG